MAMNRSDLPAPGACALLAVVLRRASCALNNLLFGGARASTSRRTASTRSPRARARSSTASRSRSTSTLLLRQGDARRGAAAQLRAARARAARGVRAARRRASIRLQVIDPVAFSEAEDRAAEFGLQAVPLEPAASRSISASPAAMPAASTQVIPFFQPEREELPRVRAQQDARWPGRGEEAGGRCGLGAADQRRLRHDDIAADTALGGDGAVAAGLRGAQPPAHGRRHRRGRHHADGGASGRHPRQHAVRDRPVRAEGRQGDRLRRSVLRIQPCFGQPDAGSGRAGVRFQPAAAVQGLGRGLHGRQGGG